ncbi:MAG: hypothetical protein AAGA99_06060 [Actinomycetota bacterium]
MSAGPSLAERIDELVGEHAATDDAIRQLVSEAGDRESLEAARVELQRRVRRNSADHDAVKGLRLVSGALQQLPRDEVYGFFNRGRRRSR